jgi:meiosis-specific protein
LFYYDHTPDDYEPPHFRSGDSKADKWFFTTHDKGEVPEKCSIGQVQTGWHGVNLLVASVSGYLPSAEDNSAPFMGTTAENGHGVAPPPLTPKEEADLRREQAEVQKQDSRKRKIVWDAEEGLADADGEADDGWYLLTVMLAQYRLTVDSDR